MAQAIGIDIGGTFVDVVVADESGFELTKQPSTPKSPAAGVLSALDRLVAEGAVDPRRVSGIAHGCTVATNALLEGTWARVALVTTRGFRDVLEIGRQNRPSLYDLHVRRPAPLVPRELRFEVGERTNAAGEIELPLATHEIEELGDRLRAAGVDAVAVAFLFSYLRPEHERAVRDVLQRELGVPVTLSSDVLPEIREYERTSTTVLAAALRPVIGEYVQTLEDGAAARGFPRGWRVMQSSGTVTTAARAQEQPAGLLLSGPAAGVQGARVTGARLGETNLITVDMGGTSCDVALVTGGAVERTQRGAVGGYPVALPMLAVHTIGAGGGSRAWIDAGGALRVGPQSMGADPGPACYGRGGRATVTDAHLTLGRLVGHAALGGLGELDAQAARAAIGGEIATPLEMSVEEAALGILEVADAAMERAIRVVTVERGHDPRDYALLAFGGAGPLHGVPLAQRLGLRRVVVPRAAGVLSAFGLVVAETGHDYSQSLVRRLADLEPENVAVCARSLQERAWETLRAEGVEREKARFIFQADVRYVRQSHELTVPIRIDGAADLGGLRRDFEAAHEERYGHAFPDADLELVTLRLRAEGPALGSPDVRWRGQEQRRGDAKGEPWDVWLDARGPRRGRLCRREALIGESFRGPMVVLGDDATIWVPGDCRGTCDDEGNLLLEVR